MDGVIVFIEDGRLDCLDLFGREEPFMPFINDTGWITGTRRPCEKGQSLIPHRGEPTEDTCYVCRRHFLVDFFVSVTMIITITRRLVWRGRLRGVDVVGGISLSPGERCIVISAVEL
jgi:hypothetical protein